MAASRAPGLRRNFGWSFAGSAAFTFSQYLLVILLARLTVPRVVGEFSLLLAIAAPVFLTMGLNLRTMQATDAARGWSMSDYLALRRVLNVGASLVVLVAGGVAGLAPTVLGALAFLCLAKSIESVSHTYYGYFQQHDRLDFVGRSLMVRSLAGPSLFLLGLVVGDDLVWGCAGLAIGWFLPQLLLDQPGARQIARDGGAPLHGEAPTDWRSVMRLARLGVPLGVDAGVSSLALNVPRYVVAAALGPAALGVFTALAYLAQTVQMVTSSFAAALIGRLAVYHHAGQRRAFFRAIRLLTGLGVVVSLAAIAGALAVGAPVLRAILGEEYADVSLLVLLLVAMGVATVHRSLCKGLEASRVFGTYMVVDVVTTAAVSVLALLLVPAYGLPGAAYALAGGFLVGLVPVVVALGRVARALPRSQTTS